VIPDNTGGHLMQHGKVDLCIVGTDRTTARGDVCNKIGTYLKALAAHANNVPFYVALPHTTIDWTIEDGVKEIPIEERSPREVTHMTGRLPDGSMATIDIMAPGSTALNYAFDVTPAQVMLVASHEDDLDAAAACGLQTAHVSRPWELGPGVTIRHGDLSRFTLAAQDFNDLADRLTDGRPTQLPT